VVQNLQPDSASLVFHTSGEQTFELEWRALPDGESWRKARIDARWLVPPEARATSPLAKITARIDRLPAGGRIECRLLSNGVESGPRWPLRVPSAGDLGSILAIGDSGYAGPDQQAVLRHMQAVENPELLIHTGDLAYPTANFSSLRQHYFEPYAGLMAQIPFYPVLGNHDTPEDQGASLIGMHDLPDSPGVLPGHRGRYYSLVRGPAHLLFLDSNEPLLEPEGENRMLAWLKAELERSRSFWRIAVFHHTPFPSGRHANDALCARARSLILPILERYEVPLVLCGHEHLYKRTQAPPPGKPGTMVLTTGGGGGGLYPSELSAPNVFARSVHHFVQLSFAGASLRVRAIDSSGEVFDEALLAPPPSIQGVAWEPGNSIHIDGRHLALTGDEGSVEVELNRQPIDPARLTATSLELPFTDFAPPSGELRVRTRNGERVLLLQPDQI
jgi:hypothetical protein